MSVATATRQSFADLNRLRLELPLGTYRAELLYWGYFDGASWWRNYLHKHSFFEVCYVYSGEGAFCNNGHTYPLKQADLFIAKPGEQHEIISSQRAPLALYFWSYTLVPAASPSQADIDLLLSSFMEKGAVLVSNGTKTFAILEALTAEITNQAIAYPVMIDSLTRQLLIDTARAATQLNSKAPLGNATSHESTVVTTIKRYLRDNYSRAPQLKDIAAQVHLSERHMSRLFKAETGSSIKQYATDIKLSVAKQLLLNPELSIADVAYETGYQDARHFSTVFRKRTGSSPSVYRETGGTAFI